MNQISKWMLLPVLLVVGCGQSAKQPPAPADPPATVEVKREQPETPPQQAPEMEPEKEVIPELPVITFGGGTGTAPSTGTTGSSKMKGASGKLNRVDQVIAGLKDLQILLGTWRGITQKNFDGSKKLDETNWVWDLTTDPEQPVLALSSEASPYYRSARLTFYPEMDLYQLKLTDSEGQEFLMDGEFLEQIATEPGEDDKPQKTYKLAFTQSGDQMGRRFVFNQQNNNRYLLEVYDRRAGNDQFFRVDTVSTQREGTSMALIDEGYGEKTCIISGGLGTISVSYQGNTYYVCCTGCKAAFDEDPERWIARFKENSN